MQVSTVDHFPVKVARRRQEKKGTVQQKSKRPRGAMKAKTKTRDDGRILYPLFINGKCLLIKIKEPLKPSKGKGGYPASIGDDRIAVTYGRR